MKGLARTFPACVCPHREGSRSYRPTMGSGQDATCWGPRCPEVRCIRDQSTNLAHFSDKIYLKRFKLNLKLLTGRGFIIIFNRSRQLGFYKNNWIHIKRFFDDNSFKTYLPECQKWHARFSLWLFFFFLSLGGPYWRACAFFNMVFCYLLLLNGIRWFERAFYWVNICIRPWAQDKLSIFLALFS